MKTKQEKIPALSSEHKEALALLEARPEFKAFVSLLKIEENNIIVQSAKLNSTDLNLALKKALLEGRMYEIRKIIKTFELVKKGEDE